MSSEKLGLKYFVKLRKVKDPNWISEWKWKWASTCRSCAAPRPCIDLKLPTLNTQPVTNNITFIFTIFEQKSPESTFPPQLFRRSDQEWNTIQGLRSPVTMITIKIFMKLFREMKMKWGTSFYPSYIYFKPPNWRLWSIVHCCFFPFLTTMQCIIHLFPAKMSARTEQKYSKARSICLCIFTTFLLSNAGHKEHSKQYCW